MVRALTLAVVLLSLAPASASAAVAPQFGRLERVDIEPYLANLTRVRAYLNLIKVEGSLIKDIKPDELQLVVGDARLKAVPGIARFESSDSLLDLVVLVEVHSSFVSAIEDLEEPVERLIGRLPRQTTRVAIVSYGEKVKIGNLQDPSSAARRWRRLVPDDVPDRPQLAEALKRSVRMLANAAPMRPASSVRKLILVISDGNDLDVDTGDTRDEFRKIARQAADAGIVIHSLAFSLADNRLPFLNLGEISKKTQGTFRWARTRADFGPHIESITDEIRRQMVLTFLLPSDQKIEPGTNLTVICRSARCEGSLESNPRRAPKMLCSGQACDLAQACIAGTCRTVRMTGARGSSAAIIAVIFGLLASAGFGALYVKKFRPRGKENEARPRPGQPAGASAPAGAPAMPAGQPQIVLPDFSNMPYVGGSAAAQQAQAQLAHLPYVGAAMAAQQAAAQRAAPPVAAATRVPSIMVLSGPMKGQMFPLRHGFTVGKLRGCDLLVDDGFTSGHHAQFHLDTAGGCTVVDLGSTNGTYVNGVRSMSQRLSHGMSVRVGQTELRFLQG